MTQTKMFKCTTCGCKLSGESVTEVQSSSECQEDICNFVEMKQPTTVKESA